MTWVKRFVPTPECVRLVFEGAQTLSRMESAGVRVDRAYVEDVTKRTLDRIRDRRAEMQSDPVYKVWRRRFGGSSNVASPDQMSKVVFGELGYKTDVRTKSDSRESASEKALAGIDIPIAKLYLEVRKLERLAGTYLGGLTRELVQHHDGTWRVHPFFHLNIAETGRSSSTQINYQNQYTRDPEYAEVMRRAFIPRPGRQFVELDYGAHEVKICACYTGDPTALAECRDPKSDAHRDAARRLFFLKAKEVSKSVRGVAKGPFVFAQFYGDYYLKCAQNIWGLIQKETVKGTQETILDRLRANGVIELGDCDPREEPRPGTFEKHVKSVEDWYWNDKYKVHTQWKRDWWAAYQRDGGFLTKTGYAVWGPGFRRNEIVNNPIQGDAFRVLLWSLVRQDKLLRKHKMDSLLVGEIHDCSVADCTPQERDDYIEMSVDVMTRQVVKHWPWIVVPLTVEPEICPVDASWHEKVKLTLSGEKYVPKDPQAWAEKYGPWERQCAE